MLIPILVTPGDVVRIVNYLRSKPTGVSADQAAAVLNEVVDRRKLAAFQLWGLIKKEDGKIKLDERGWSLARGAKSIEMVMREILEGQAAYHSALEWMYHQQIDIVISADVATYWQQFHPEAISTTLERTMMDQALCFFRVAEAAGLGKTVTGRRGAPTRFEPIRQVLSEFLDGMPTTTQTGTSGKKTERANDDPTPTQEIPDSDLSSESENYVRVENGRRLKVFVAHGKNGKLVKQVEDILTHVAGIDCEIATKDEDTAIPVPEKVFGAMKRCTAGVVIVSREELQAGAVSSRINENVLIEIGAAFMLYDRRVVLLWEKGVPVPSNLEGLYRCEFEGNDLAFPEVIKLTKALRKFTDERQDHRKAS